MVFKAISDAWFIARIVRYFDLGLVQNVCAEISVHYWFLDSVHIRLDCLQENEETKSKRWQLSGKLDRLIRAQELLNRSAWMSYAAMWYMSTDCVLIYVSSCWPAKHVPPAAMVSTSVSVWAHTYSSQSSPRRYIHELSTCTRIMQSVCAASDHRNARLQLIDTSSSAESSSHLIVDFSWLHESLFMLSACPYLDCHFNGLQWDNLSIGFR